MLASSETQAAASLHIALIVRLDLSGARGDSPHRKLYPPHRKHPSACAPKGLNAPMSVSQARPMKMRGALMPHLLGRNAAMAKKNRARGHFSSFTR